MYPSGRGVCWTWNQRRKVPGTIPKRVIMDANQLCSHWWHKRLHFWPPPVPRVTTKVAPWQIIYFSATFWSTPSAIDNINLVSTLPCNKHPWRRHCATHRQLIIEIRHSYYNSWCSRCVIQTWFVIHIDQQIDESPCCDCWSTIKRNAVHRTVY